MEQPESGAGKKVVIVGAGMAGLSAGIHARRKGYDVVILERHHVPGGMCASWKRGAFRFEGCLHFIGLFGASPNHPLNPLWEDLGVFPGIRIEPFSCVHEFRDVAGRSLRLYTDMDKLERELLALSPRDGRLICRVCRLGRLGAAWIRPPHSARDHVASILAFARLLPTMIVLKDRTMGQFASRFRDPLIRRAFEGFFVYPDMAAAALPYFLGSYHARAAGYPEGSSLAVAEAMAERFRALGGSLRFRSRVSRILVDDGLARGVQLADGTVERADIVIVSAHPDAVLPPDAAVPAPVTGREREADAWFHPFVQVSFGVRLDLSFMERSLHVELDTPITVAGTERTSVLIHHFCIDPDSAPRGMTSVVALYPSRASWWRALGYRSARYLAEKEAALRATIEALERVIPGIAAAVEVSDVATPLTVERYSGSPDGAIGYMMSPKVASSAARTPRYRDPEIANVYRIGQWVRGMGLPMAVLSGKEVFDEIATS